MDKTTQRKTASGLRAELSTDERREKSLCICRNLMELPEIKKADIIFSYNAIKDEADLKSINNYLMDMGKKLCFPVSGKNGIMEAFCPGKWREGLYGITEPEPENSELIAPEDISLVLAPCLAFDEEGNRMGYGGGYYDRFLPRCAKAEIIACAFEVQKFPKLITGKYDRKLNMAVTENNIYRF